MAWAAIGYGYKSKIYFCSYEGERKGFTQKKYADQILRALSRRCSSNQVISFAWRIIVKFMERQILDKIMESVMP